MANALHYDKWRRCQSSSYLWGMIGTNFQTTGLGSGDDSLTDATATPDIDDSQVASASSDGSFITELPRIPEGGTLQPIAESQALGVRGSDGKPQPNNNGPAKKSLEFLVSKT
eukprot:scaffold63490_cov19-Prasinocladus_malaysianus.AAC.1